MKIINKNNDKKVCDAYIKGDSALSIQSKIGINYKTVYRILKRNNIKIRSHKEKSLNAIKNNRGSNSKLQRETMSKLFTGKTNPRWKPIGTKRICHGYILVKTRYGWSQEHRIVAEKFLKRKLKKSEVVHHIDGKKDNNKPDNLFVMTSTEHKSFHIIERLKKTKGQIGLTLTSNLTIS